MNAAAAPLILSRAGVSECTPPGTAELAPWRHLSAPGFEKEIVNTLLDRLLLFCVLIHEVTVILVLCALQDVKLKGWSGRLVSSRVGQLRSREPLVRLGRLKCCTSV